MISVFHVATSAANSSIAGTYIKSHISKNVLTSSYLYNGSCFSKFYM